MEFSLLSDGGYTLTEGPVWDDRRGWLFFVDIPAPAVHAITLDGEAKGRWAMPRAVGSIGLTESGRVLCAVGAELIVLDPESGSLAPFAALPPEPATNRLNDGKVGPDGAFWVGSMDQQGPPRQPLGHLYRVTGDGKVERKLSGLCVSNGLAFHPDGKRMIHTDSFGQWIDRWDLDTTTGAISGRTRIATPNDPVGRPDGGACDAEGVYWSAGVSAGRLNRWSMAGELLGWHPTPVPAPTMPCFCGPDLKTLVVTSLKPGPDRPVHPLSGQVFIARSPIAGAAIGRVRGL